MYKLLFLDLDDTILDFRKSERAALRAALGYFGITATPELLEQYHQVNRQYWQMLERGEITRERVLTERFETLLSDCSLPEIGKDLAEVYEQRLALEHDFLPGAEQTVHRLCCRHRLFLMSNGTAPVQYRRLHDAGLTDCFEKIFISQEIGADKPDRRFFDRCFGQIPDFSREQAILVGDSLTSDMRGANHAGIAACWVNPEHKPRPADIRIDYEISSFAQIEGVLDNEQNLD